MSDNKREDKNPQEGADKNSRWDTVATWEHTIESPNPTDSAAHPRDEKITGNGPEEGKETAEGKETEGKEIDILAMIYQLWGKRKLLLIWCMWGVLAGLIIAFSIPKEFTTSVKLAPETKNTRANMSGGLGALASMAGISASGNSGSDAVYPTLYPEILNSVPFITSLFDVPVTDSKGKTFTVREYLLEETRKPWWDAVTSAPGKLVGIVASIGSKSEESGDSVKTHVTDNFKLTPRESSLVGALRGRISTAIDQKTSVITVTTQMQDPVVSAILVDTVVARLKEYVTNYRTDKARQDLNYAQKLNDEAQQEYYRTQQMLADYIDRNQNLATRSAQVTRERLENETSLAFNLYNETSLQVQNAKSRVQEITPVYTVLMPATVPMRPVSPKKGLIIGGCTFIAFVACAAWILFGSTYLGQYKTKLKEIKEKSAADPTNNDGKETE